jgi:uncharacterized protein (TIGR03067 family)
MGLTLAVLAVAARADDDPEPPGRGAALLRQLKGRWTLARQTRSGREVKVDYLVYEFDGDKLTLDNGQSKSVWKMKVDFREKPVVLERTEDKRRLFCKIEKGELYLAGDHGGSKADPTFAGKSGNLVVFKREKK